MFTIGEGVNGFDLQISGEGVNGFNMKISGAAGDIRGIKDFQMV